jgi:hypothetical protein
MFFVIGYGEATLRFGINRWYMTIFRVEHDINRYCGFRAQSRDHFRSVFRELLTGRTLMDVWTPGEVDMIRGRRGNFVGGPTLFAGIAVTKKTLDRIGRYLEAFAELLPFEYQGQTYWALYLPKAYDCLDFERSEFWGSGVRDPAHIAKVVLVKTRIPADPLFRIKDTFDYYGKEEFKKLVEEHRLTGLKFREVWSDETREQGEQAESTERMVIASPESGLRPQSAQPEPFARKPGRINKRDRLLLRLWREVINHRGTVEWLKEELNAKNQDDEEFPYLFDPSQVLNQAEAAGLSEADLRRLVRGIAYQVVFDTLVAIEEECALKAPYAGLHEDLLMAGSDPRAQPQNVQDVQ